MLRHPSIEVVGVHAVDGVDGGHERDGGGLDALPLENLVNLLLCALVAIMSNAADEEGRVREEGVRARGR
jgi:hypothetical protein